MPKITSREATNSITVRTQPGSKNERAGTWWKANSKSELTEQLLGTAGFLKEQSQFRYRQAAVYARLYGNMPLFGWVGSNLSRIGNSNSLPIDRPTMSVISSCVDTLVSRMTQSRPRPVFLTDNADYKQRNLAKQLNNFLNGELYQTKAYELGALVIRDAAVLGTGVIKIFEDQEKKVCLERKLCTEILVDPNDSLYGDPRQLYEVKLVDRSVLAEAFPKYRSQIDKAQQAFVDSGSEATKTVSDQIMVVEGWHLESAKSAGDGRHVIACSEGVIFDEEYTKKKFPFVFLHYSPRLLGFWGQGLAEQLMGTQVEINKLLMTISQAINLVGVPRIFVEDGSKVVKAQLNNNIGSIVTYRGTKPQYEVAPCVPGELYMQLQRLIDYSYQQSGISSLAATSQKPAGLNSGAAMREYDDLQSDRFAALAKRYDNMYVDLAYQIIDLAKEIADRDGEYQTIYPNKNGTKQIDLPKADMLKNPFVIQCYDVSSLPRDPAGRKQTVIEMMQAGLITPQEGRRLLDYTDIEQVDKLANAGEERILQVLDNIVDEGKFSPPDPFMDISLAEQLTTQYYNLYEPAKLDEERLEMLRQFFTQIQALKAQAAAAMAPPPGAMPQANPEAPAQSDMIPNVPAPAGA
ncbi:MAG TPA: hypothetical protein PLN81_11280 [Bacillota bacterium]|nr:hypothetical protein [Bacillota bacterium]